VSTIPDRHHQRAAQGAVCGIQPRAAGLPWGERGLGLGLSICHRFAGLLQHELTLRSRRGHGSVFGVCVPREARATLVRAPAIKIPVDPTSLRDLRVLCVDNDLSILDGMEALLGQWGVQC